MEPTTVEVDAFVTFTLAILLLFVGKELTQRMPTLRKYSIPEPVVGGFLCTLVVGLLYFVANIRIHFDLNVRDLLLLYFFAGIGLKSEVKTLVAGGRPLVVLLALSATFIILQNMLGMGVASTFGLDPRAGLLVGSISLVGGIGTTLAWVPDFTERLGITNALEIGTAGSMLGLIIACIIGGPIANYLMREHKLQPSHDARLEIGVVHGADSADTRLDYYGVLRAWLWLNLALLLGQGLASMIRSTGLNLALLLGQGLASMIRSSGLNLPDFVGSLLAGIVLRNITPLILPRQSARNWKKVSQGLALISDICLGMFLTMALMGLQLWALKGVFGFVFSTLVLQVILTLFYTIWVVFRFMGKDYEAAVLCAGFGGIALGSTSTAVANMSAVTRQYGAAHRAFIIVPLVGGFFIDLVNALVISWLSR